ncbi:MAG TPA: M56 family metallopeptidase [Blastocatellia bacterium]|nr:M56 family metallopeptidase [Blastocatellia bacterium]
MNDSVWLLVVAGVENFILISGVLSLLTFTAAATVRFVARGRGWHPHSLTRIYAALLVLPVMVSAWLVTASLLPAIWLGLDRWAQEHQALHTLHLLNAWTVSVDPALGYAALAFAVLAAVFAAYAALSAYFRIGRVIRRLEVEADPAPPERVRQVEDACRQNGIDVGLVVSRYPLSFVWGYLRSKLVVSTGLLNALSAEELSALLEHEAAHHARRDNLSKWILTVCRYASPVFPLMNQLYRWWNEQVELVCDEIAAKRTNSPVEVAGALLRIKRLTLAARLRRLQIAESGFFGDDGDRFEYRVMRLLSLEGLPEETMKAAALSRSWARSATFIGSAFVLTLVALFLVSPLAVHRLVEILLHPF